MNIYTFPGLDQEAKITTDKIFKVIEQTLDVTKQEIINRDRSLKIKTARHIAAFLLKKRGFRAYEVGEILKRDYTTVLWSVKTIQSLYDTEREFRTLIHEIQRKVGFYKFKEL